MVYSGQSRIHSSRGRLWKLWTESLILIMTVYYMFYSNYYSHWSSSLSTLIPDLSLSTSPWWDMSPLNTIFYSSYPFPVTLFSFLAKVAVYLALLFFSFSVRLSSLRPWFDELIEDGASILFLLGILANPVFRLLISLLVGSGIFSTVRSSKFSLSAFGIWVADRFSIQNFLTPGNMMLTYSLNLGFRSRAILRNFMNYKSEKKKNLGNVSLLCST